jgi:hypothetical protein
MNPSPPYLPAVFVPGRLSFRNLARRILASLAAALLLAAAWPAAHAAGLEEGEVPAPVLAALVQVEAFVQAAEGEEPDAAGWSRRCPKCGEYHVNELSQATWSPRTGCSRPIR